MDKEDIKFNDWIKEKCKKLSEDYYHYKGEILCRLELIYIYKGIKEIKL